MQVRVPRQIYMQSKGQIKIVFIALGVIVVFLIIHFGGILLEREPSAEPTPEEVISPELEKDKTPPVRGNLFPDGTLAVGITQTKISLSTNEPAECRYSTLAGAGYYSILRKKFSASESKIFHSTQVKGLKNGKIYQYFVRCKDLKGNKNPEDVIIQFRVGGGVSSLSTYTPPSGPSAGPDTTPPFRSNLYPSGNLPAGTFETQISLSTNEPAECRYSTLSGAGYYSILRKKFSPSEDQRLHTAKVKGLGDDKIYQYFVRCKDLEGNKNPEDAMIQFSVGSVSLSPSPAEPGEDITPPHRFNPSPEGDLPAQTRKITLSLETDEIATCKYATVSGIYYEYIQHTFSNTNTTSHSTLITTLSEGQDYQYYVRCIDKQGNKNLDDFVISFGVKAPEDTTPPERRGLMPEGVLPAGTTKVQIYLWTNEPAYCRYSTEQGLSYKSMRKSFSRNETKTFHTAKIKNLEDGKIYDFFVRCKDLEGNTNTGDVLIRFEVGL